MKPKSPALYILYTYLIIFSFVPLSLIFMTSFLTPNAVNLVSMPLTLNNYLDLLDPSLIHIAARSISMAMMTTFFCLVIAYPFSYLLVKSKHQSLLLLLILIPFWTSSLVRTYALLAILKAKGLLNLILIKCHLISAPLPLLYSNFAVISGLVYNLFPFMVLPIFNNMERFDFRLLEAAKDLGASGRTIFFKVFLPNTMPGVASGCLLVFLPAMTLFYIPNVLGGARSILLGNLIQNQFLVSENWPLGAATSTLLTLIFLFMLLVFRKSKTEEVR